MITGSCNNQYQLYAIDWHVHCIVNCLLQWVALESGDHMLTAVTTQHPDKSEAAC